MTGIKVKPETAAVVGGGLVGMACALNLQAQGVQTLVIDPQPGRSASWGNAGHIAVEQVEPLASGATLRSVPNRLFWRGGAVSLPPADIGAWLPFALRLVLASRPDRFRAGKAALRAALGAAAPAWRRLAQGADAAHLVIENGHFVVWETPSGAEAGRAAWARADIGAASIREATPEEMAELAGRVSRPLAGAIRFSGTGQVLDLDELAHALAARFTALGGAQRALRARRIEVSNGRAALIADGGGRIGADTIVVAAGVDSAALLAPLGHRVPLIAERGYHIQSARPHWPAGAPPVVFEERSMIVTRFNSGLRASSFVEFARRQRPADARKWERLRSHVDALGLGFAEPLTRWMGARPTLPDYLPAIGRSRRAGNLYYAFGHQHLGLTLAAFTGEAMGALVSGEPSPVDLAAFDIDRF